MLGDAQLCKSNKTALSESQKVVGDAQGCMTSSEFNMALSREF